MDAYAGYYLEEKKLKQSSSGGIVSAISEEIIAKGGAVYGAVYSENFHNAVYDRAEKREELEKFKGSKYVYVSKLFIKDGKRIPVYREVLNELTQGMTILFIGLGCDIAVLRMLAGKGDISTEKLYTIELLCDGVTDAAVHESYISYIEGIYGSEVVSFSVRYKEEGWTPGYIHAEFKNGKEYIWPFYESDYGIAFQNYKRKACYSCQYKGKNHQGDLVVGDFWGCRPGMETYNVNGVSLSIVQTEKGNILLDYLNKEHFFIKKIDTQYALYNNPRYFTSHERYSRWDMFDRTLKEKGLQEAVRICTGISMPERFKMGKNLEIILWGAGKLFHQYISVLSETFSVSCVVDSNADKWGKELKYGFFCQSPDILKNKKNSMVLIMIRDAGAAFQVANRLLDMGITRFDHISNWIRYTE